MTLPHSLVALRSRPLQVASSVVYGSALSDDQVKSARWKNGRGRSSSSVLDGSNH